MKKITIGYIFNEPHLKNEEKSFLRIAKKKGIELMMINAAKDLDEEEIRKKIRNCDLVFNNSAETFSEEIAKTIEELGKKVIESSKSFYYDEDKWMFFLKCKKYRIPTPKTILLSQNVSIAKKELEKFNQWPLVLKRIEGTNGEYVEKADNLTEAKKIIRRFWKRGSERLPIIAQEFILSHVCYRATIINNKIVQTAIKESKNWKESGISVYSKKKFNIDEQLKKIVRKISKAFNLHIYGIDLFKVNGKWIVLEINSEPSFDFFKNKREINRMIGLVLDFLKKKAR